MKRFRFLLLYAVLFTACSFSAAKTGNDEQQKLVLVGSTPGDALIKSMLRIDQQKPVDFIRWKLILDQPSSGDFSLDYSYGLGQNNTLHFTKDSGRRAIAGKYTLQKTDNNKLRGTLYHLSSTALPGKISLLKLNDNLFHVLSPENQLIVGNGGWSYSLNREVPVKQPEQFSSLFLQTSLLRDTATQLTFDGRTPCSNFVRDYHFAASPDCFKLKWRLILYRDPKTLQPTTYSINRTLSRGNLLTGPWVVKKHPSQPGAFIVQLDPDQPDQSISFLVGDENILFFLDKNYQLYHGNKDFSYTLNRVPVSPKVN